MTTPDFFRSRLDAMIDLKHPLVVLATRRAIEASLAPKWLLEGAQMMPNPASESAQKPT